jgi:4-hydroxybenzoate polyprenyltransferase
MARHSIPDIIEQAEPRPERFRVPARPLAWNLVLSLRPEQWTKNLLIFAGLIFGQRLLDGSAVLTSIAAFAVFCALSGVVYLVNDVADREADRQHPLKRHRPIASGAVPIRVALVTAAALTAVALAAAFRLRFEFGVVATAYVVLLGMYSGPLKHVVIIDVLTIAIGFALRAAAGALVLGVTIGPWLLIDTVLLALFLALSKRRHELVLLGDGAPHHRRILAQYSPYLLDQMISVVTASTLIAYTVFTLSAETAQRLGTPFLGFTVPFVLYGIFRYLYLVHQKRGGDSPAEMLLTDRPLLVCVALWAGTVVLLMYSPIGR